MLAIVLALILIYDRHQPDTPADSYVPIETADETQENIFSIFASETPPDGPLLDAVNVQNDPGLGEILVTPAQFKENARQTDSDSFSRYVSASYRCDDISGSNEDVYVLQFTGRTANGEPAELTATVGDISANVFLSGTPKTFFVPVTEVSGIGRVNFHYESEYSETILDDIYLVRYAPGTGIDQFTIGCYANDDTVVTTQLDAEDFLGKDSRQCLVKGDYIYSLQSNAIVVYRRSGSSFRQVYTLTGLSSQNRDMEFTGDQNGIAVTARQEGLYLVDITNPERPTISSHYDTLEATTGLCVNGDYAFLCDRYLGVEVVDLSDLAAPKYVSQIQSDGEFQNCTFSDGKLFVADYNKRRIVIFDVHDLSQPERLCEIPLDGSGQGVFVEGHLLYAATALNSRNNENTPTWRFGAGTGNGLEIYDISDITQPKLLSITKVEGRMSVNTSAVWDVVVSDGYAYYSDMHNGVYVYDVSDPKSPVKAAHYEYTIPSGQEINSQYVVDWDPAQESRGVAWHCVPMDGELLLSFNNSGLIAVDCSFAKAVPDSEAYAFQRSQRPETVEAAKVFQVDTYRSDACFWGVDVYEGDLFAACGDYGIQRFSSDLELKDVYETEYSVMDVAVYGDLLISAETTDGIVIYQIGDSLEKLGQYTPQNAYCSALEISADGKTVLVQETMAAHFVVDISDPKNPQELAYERNTGSMYFRNICQGLVSDKYLCIFGSQAINFYTMENDELVAHQTGNFLYGERTGMTAVGDKLLSMTGDGYYYYDTADDFNPQKITVPGYFFGGKCSNNGSLLVVSEPMNQQIQIVDITSLASPVVLDSIQVNGTPDIACFNGDDIIVPCRYSGLIRLRR